MNKIGIICAGDTELEPFLHKIEIIKTTEKAMLKFYEGKIGDVTVIVLYSGVCKVNAAIATEILIDSFGVNIIINAGTAGGMDENVQLFDTVISEQCAYHDVADDILRISGLPQKKIGKTHFPGGSHYQIGIRTAGCMRLWKEMCPG